MEKIERWEIGEIQFKNRYGKMITRPIEGSYEEPTLDLDSSNLYRINSFDDLPNFNVIAPYLTEFSIRSPIKEKIDLRIFKNIQKLSLHLPAREIEGIDTLKHLRYLDLSYTHVKVIEGLQNLKKLRRLNLSHANLNKIPVLEILNKLETLDLSHNQISKIEGLDGLENLRELNLSNNNISKIEGLDGFKDIYGIYLSNNNISKIENLTKMQTLQKIRLNSNPISKIEGLDGMKKLDSISLSDTKIKSIDGIASLPDLYSVDISNTAVSSLEPLKKYKKIAYIYAKNCPIRSLHGIINDSDQLRKLIISPENLCPTGAQLYKIAISGSTSVRNFDINEIPPLLEFYRRSTTALALQYIKQFKSNPELTNSINSPPLPPLNLLEIERLIHEATQKERQILENAVEIENLPPNDSVLSKITARFSIDIS